MGSIKCSLVANERISRSSDVPLQWKLLLTHCALTLWALLLAVSLTRATRWFPPRQQALYLGSTALRAPSVPPFVYSSPSNLLLAKDRGRWWEIHFTLFGLPSEALSLPSSLILCFFPPTINFGGLLPLQAESLTIKILVCLPPPNPPSLNIQILPLGKGQYLHFIILYMKEKKEKN